MFEILLILIIIVLLATVAVCGYIIRNLIIQNQTYESWVVNFTKRSEDTLVKMRDIDERQMFESDDDVGIVFQELKSLVEDLNEKLGDNEDEEDQNTI